MSLTVAQAIAAYNANPNLAPVAVADIAANIGGSALDQLQVLTSHGKLQSITVTDTSTAYGRVSATTAQIGAQFGDGDSATLALIVSPYRLLVSDLYSQFYGNIPSNCNDIYLQQARGWSIYGNNFFDTILITAAYVPGFFNGAHNLVAGNAGSYIVLNNVADSHEQATLLGGAGGGPAGPGNTIYANDGDNFLQGGAGSPSDVLVATGSGRNQLFGGSGNNYIVGGTGRNIIAGGGGALQSLWL
jgi:Ca2+-binding RTX toxin-like protein